MAASPSIKSGATPVICFASGSLIQTPNGERRVEALRVGDEVITLDHGAQPLRWIGRTIVRASGELAPVCIPARTMGNHSDLFVSPEHRMLCLKPLSRKHFQADETLATASRLVDAQIASVAYGGMVSYIHLMFDRHQVIFANGAPSESFHPAGLGLESLQAPARHEFFRTFPKLRADIGAYGPTSRPYLGVSMNQSIAVA